jgi:hypothetical protein
MQRRGIAIMIYNIPRLVDHGTVCGRTLSNGDIATLEALSTTRFRAATSAGDSHDETVSESAAETSLGG